MTRLRVGIVGFGSIVELAHLPALRALAPRIAVEAVVDSSEERRKTATAMPEVRLVAASVDDFLRTAPSLDLVVSALPPDANGVTAGRLAAAGYTVLAEKPLAATAAEARQILGDAETAGRVSMVHNYFFRTDVQAAVAAVREGAIGAVRLTRLERPDGGHFVGSGIDPHWRRSAQRHGGCLRDNAYHWIYLAPALCHSEIDDATARVSSRRSDEVEDVGHAVLRHANGALTTVTTAWCAISARPVLEVHGETGSLRLLGDENACEINTGAGWTTLPGRVGVNSYEQMYRHLLDVGAGADERLSVQSGLRVLDVLDQLYAAASDHHGDGGPR
ncbi:Gfo/Idh/MocA family protein [Micromonospora sp. NPDC051141]|uniref:Gfo/Idh/MocA family protein n=1 Tax=Micromonospora sp. NPDC051141 TaxID=3364284 RepID=UPI003787DD54